MDPRAPLQRLYAARLARRLTGGRLPEHVALIMDGNRRWAREQGFDNPSVGHRFGAEHVETVLGWCAGLGIRHVTVWVASADNIRRREGGEVAFLMQLAEEVIAVNLARPGAGWRIEVVGQLDLLPDSTVHALKLAVEQTRDRTEHGVVTVAIGYGGQQEIVEAVRAVLLSSTETLDELSRTLTEERIAAELAVLEPYPDLVIRTSGEIRLSDFLLWQAAHAELVFCDVYWPGFRRIDFLRALRSFSQRTSR